MLALVFSKLGNVTDGEEQDLRERCCYSKKNLQLSATVYLALWPARHQTFHALGTDSH